MAYFKVPMVVYIEAFDEKTAMAVAEINAFSGTIGLRKANSGWIEDETTKLTVAGKPIEIDKNEIPKESYSKEVLTEVYGEERAINVLNYMVNRIYE